MVQIMALGRARNNQLSKTMVTRLNIAPPDETNPIYHTNSHKNIVNLVLSTFCKAIWLDHFYAELWLTSHIK